MLPLGSEGRQQAMALVSAAATPPREWRLSASERAGGPREGSSPSAVKLTFT